MAALSEQEVPFVGGASFIEPPTWQAIARQLTHLAQFSGGVHVVDGNASSGKTVFAHHLSELLTEEVSCGVLALPAGLATQQVFECVLQALGVDVGDRQSIGESIAALRQFDHRLKQEQVRKILVIDDAHRLDAQSLSALASIFQGSSDNEVGFALVLIGEPGVALRLDQLNLVDVEVRDYMLPAFSVAEAKELLIEEFAAAFPEYEFPLTDDVITALWTEASGAPGRVLSLAQEAWQQAESNEGLSLWRSFPIWHVIALVILLLALLWGFLARDLSGSTSDKESLPNDFVTEAPTRENSNDTQNGFSTAEKEAVVESSESALTSKDFETFGVDGIQSSPLSESVAIDADESSAFSSENITQDTSIAKESVRIAKAAAETAEPIKSAVEAKETAQPKAAETASSSVQAVAKPKTKQAKATIAQQLSDVGITGLTSDEQKLLKLPQKGFVLQVLAASSLKSLESFVQTQQNRSNLRIYRSQRAGKQWFVVVEGYYADKGSALAAKLNLPANQLKAGPWPKSTADVKREIRAFSLSQP